MTDYHLAAKKNLTDASILFENDRFDGAGYLSGYVIECVFKAVIQAEKSTAIRHIHDIDDLGKDAKKFAASPGAKTHKYHRGLNIAIGYANPPLGWRETLRYEPENTISKDIADLWVKEAQKLYGRVLKQMALDGVIKI